MNKFRLIAIIFPFLILAVSCGSPNAPAQFDESGGYKISARFATYGDANDILISDTLAYVAQGEGGLEIVSISHPENPQVISLVTENARGYSYKLTKYDSIIYIAAGSYGITVVNVARPAEAEVTASNISMKPAKGLAVSNAYLFVAISERGVKLASLSYPLEPDIRGGFGTPGYAQDLCISSGGDTAFVANGEMGLAVFDLSDFAGGFGEYPQIGWLDTEGYAENVTIDEQNKIAYLTCGTAGVFAIDYSDLNAMKIVSRYDTEGYAKDLVIDGEKLYVSSENGGVYFFEINSNGKLTKAGRIKTSDARGIAYSDDYVYVADKDDGIIIIKKP